MSSGQVLFWFATISNIFPKAYQNQPQQFEGDAWSCHIGQNFYVAEDQPDGKDFLTPENPIERLRYQIREAEDCPSGKGVLWRSILVSLYEPVDGYLEFADYVYQRMSDEDQVKFVKDIFKVGINFYAAMPLSSGKRLLQLYEQGKLEISQGFKNITFDVDYCSLKMEQQDGKITYVDYVVDATNQTTNLNRHPLYSQLIEDGLTVTHPAGGISMNPKLINYWITMVVPLMS